jgi:hypothetical protein
MKISNFDGLYLIEMMKFRSDVVSVVALTPHGRAARYGGKDQVVN